MSSERDRFSRAMAFAAEAHAGQIYLGYGEHEDEPYVMHPIRVAGRVGTDSAKIVALLHDVLEDTNWGLPGFLTDEEADAVHALTRDKTRESYRHYIRRIGHYGGIAKRVKVADLRENLSRDPPDDLRERYEDALRRLADQPEREDEDE